MLSLFSMASTSFSVGKTASRFFGFVFKAFWIPIFCASSLISVRVKPVSGRWIG